MMGQSDHDNITTPVKPPERTSSVNGTVLKQITLLLDVIRSQRWSAVEHIALSKPKVFLLLSDVIPMCEEFEGMTLLHACLRQHPPLAIVMKIVMMFPNREAALRAQDQMGRTPLHIAAACNANPLILKLIGNLEPMACTIQDIDGRTPLHMACSSSSIMIQGENGFTKRQGPSYGAVCALISGSRAAATVEDKDGVTALEYAILSDADIKVVNLLQRVTQQELRRVHN